MKLLERDEMSNLYAECKRLEFEDPSLLEIEKLMGLGQEALLKQQYEQFPCLKPISFLKHALTEQIQACLGDGTNAARDYEGN